MNFKVELIDVCLFLSLLIMIFLLIIVNNEIKIDILKRLFIVKFFERYILILLF